MTLDQDDWRLVYMLENEITEARGIVNIMTNRWFAVHPKRGLVFYQPQGGSRKGKFAGASPQCNGDERIARHIAKTMPWAEIKFFDAVHVPIDPSDY